MSDLRVITLGTATALGMHMSENVIVRPAGVAAYGVLAAGVAADGVLAETMLAAGVAAQSVLAVTMLAAPRSDGSRRLLH